MSRNIASAKAGSASTAGTARDRAGNVVTVKLSGPVEVYLRNDAKSGGQEAGEQGGAESKAAFARKGIPRQIHRHRHRLLSLRPSGRLRSRGA